MRDGDVVEAKMPGYSPPLREVFKPVGRAPSGVPRRASEQPQGSPAAGARRFPGGPGQAARATNFTRQLPVALGAFHFDVTYPTCLWVSRILPILYNTLQMDWGS